MAQKPDKKGGPDDKGKQKKKGGKGIILVVWLITIVVAFIGGWQYGPTISGGVESGAGAAGERALKAQILLALDKSKLEDDKIAAAKKAINAAYDKKDVEKTAEGEKQFKLANKDDKVTSEEWGPIIKAFGG